MATYPAPQDKWNSIVRSTVKRKAMHVTSISPARLVSSVRQGNNFDLFLAFENTSKLELDYENVEIRLIGAANQVDFINPPGSTDRNSNPRVHLNTGRLDAGQERNFTVRFLARRNMATRSLKFQIGIYGVLIPEGRYWRNFSPTV